jgi:pyrroline-5-carboxylate reductase
MTVKIGFIGGGHMASAIIGGLSKFNDADNSLCVDNLWVYDRNPEKLTALAEQFAVQPADSSEHLLEQCNVIVIAVKPQATKTLIIELSNKLLAKKPLIISVVAGIQCQSIQRWIGGSSSIVRVMPNTPSLVSMGSSGMYANAQVNTEQRALCRRLFDTMGISCWVPHETDIDSVTALSGSGPAYFMLFIQSLIEAATQAGLEPSTAKTLALQTAAGTATMIKQSEYDIAQLIDNISLPAGTTERAMQSFQNAKLPAIISTAFEAARQRAEQLAIEFDR